MRTYTWDTTNRTIRLLNGSRRRWIDGALGHGCTIMGVGDAALTILSEVVGWKLARRFYRAFVGELLRREREGERTIEITDFGVHLFVGGQANKIANSELRIAKEEIQPNTDEHGSNAGEEAEDVAIAR